MVNARKHAQAGHVVLELAERDGTVIARLTDDGVGADQPRRRAGPPGDGHDAGQGRSRRGST